MHTAKLFRNCLREEFKILIWRSSDLSLIKHLWDATHNFQDLKDLGARYYSIPSQVFIKVHALTSQSCCGHTRGTNTTLDRDFNVMAVYCIYIFTYVFI